MKLFRATNPEAGWGDDDELILRAENREEAIKYIEEIYDKEEPTRDELICHLVEIPEDQKGILLASNRGG
jgi:hypothetical protein